MRSLQEIQVKDELFATLKRNDVLKERQIYGSQKKKTLHADQIQKMLRLNPTLASSYYGLGYIGYKNGQTASAPSLLTVQKYKGRFLHSFHSLVFPNTCQSQVSYTNTSLIPLRLECELDSGKLRDTFIVSDDADEDSIQLLIALSLKDYGINNLTSTTRRSITQPVISQLHHAKVSPTSEGNKLAVNTLHNKKRQKYYPALTNGAIRVILKVDVTIGRVNYVDNVEWDISNSSNDAELFASITCDELGLSGDFKTAIAHSIREQAQLYLNSYLVLTELAEQQDEDELSSFVLPHLSHAIKKTTTSTPEVMFFSSEEAERMDRDYDRETRRVRRRYGRLKRGLNLPDINDIPKTHKLLLTSGTILTDEKIYDISDTLPIPGEITKDGDQKLIITLKVPSEKLRQLIGNTIAESTSVGSTFGTQEILEKSMPAADKHEDVISITIRGNQQTFELEKPPNCVPSWLMPCLSQLKSRYPMDNYTLIIKTSDNPIDPLTIRLKCDHCENEIVSAGPANSLGNFELHLLSKKHRDLVDKKNFLM